MNHEADQVNLNPEIPNSSEIQSKEKQHSMNYLILKNTMQALNPGVIITKQFYIFTKTTIKSLQQFKNGQKVEFTKNIQDEYSEFDGVSYNLDKNDDSITAKGFRFFQRSFSKIANLFHKKEQSESHLIPQNEEQTKLIQNDVV